MLGREDFKYKSSRMISALRTKKCLLEGARRFLVSLVEVKMEKKDLDSI